jgi:N-acyl-D-glutamate deacylase
LETRKASGWSLTEADYDTGNEILRIIDKGLQDGALGIGSTLGYMRDGVTSREMFEVQKVGARYGRHTAVHTRFTPDNATFENLGLQEIIANALALDAPATINHYNNPGWRLGHEIIQRLQEQGYNIWGEIYPYAAGSTALNAVFLKPENWVERHGHKYEDTLQDPVTGDFYTLESYNKGVEETPTKEIVLFKMPPEDSVKWLTLKGTTMASDAMFAEPLMAPWNTPFEQLGNMHPRGAGARAATLRLGRENDIPMMQLLSILSYNAAHHLGRTGLKAMQERGRMQEGMVADIVVFDPETVTDNATYEQGSIPSTGFKAVIVNGEVTVRDDELLEVFAGQPIRFEPEDKPRFERVSEEAWNRRFSTGMPDVAPGIPPKGNN